MGCLTVFASAELPPSISTTETNLVALTPAPLLKYKLVPTTATVQSARKSMRAAHIAAVAVIMAVLASRKQYRVMVFFPDIISTFFFHVLPGYYPQGLARVLVLESSDNYSIASDYRPQDTRNRAEVEKAEYEMCLPGVSVSSVYVDMSNRAAGARPGRDTPEVCGHRSQGSLAQRKFDEPSQSGGNVRSLSSGLNILLSRSGTYTACATPAS